MMERERPYISLNMASSIDGKTTTFQLEKIRFSSSEDRELMEDLRSRADAILIGTRTLVTDDPPLLLRIPSFQLKRQLLGKRTRHPINVVISSSLDFPVEDSDFFNCPETEKMVFTTTAAPREKLDRVSRYAQVIQLPADERGKVDLQLMAKTMLELDINTLMLEGGGSLNFEMLRRNLIDEINLTLCPLVIGGQTAPTTFDGAGFSKEFMKKLKLDNIRAGAGGELFLRYKAQNMGNVTVQPSSVFRKGFVVC
ncbi:MAG TPA: RibD family protein [Blastocatellia bacterium]|nr:RibD family protein [Blastocatellia bacterium]